MSGMMIGIPTLERPVSMDWAFALKSLNPPINFNVVMSIVKNQPVADARNQICEDAIARGLDYVMFIGDDTVPPAHALREFLFYMGNNRNLAVIGGIYFTKTTPSFPLCFKGNGSGPYWDWKVGEVFSVTGMGMDCTMIRTSFLKELSKPWFRTIDTDNFMDATNHAEAWTEDLFMLEKLKREFPNAEILAHAGVLPMHQQYENGAWKNYGMPSYSLPTRKMMGGAENTHKIVDLGCGPVRQHFPEGIPVRVDMDERWEPDYRADVRNLPFEHNEFDIVFSSHVLEHFSKADQNIALREWIRILKPGGELRLVLPNMAWAAIRVPNLHKMNPTEKRDVMNVLYGGQTSQYDFHYNGFTPDTLKALLTSFGLIEKTYREEGYNMITSWLKPNNSDQFATMCVAEAPKEIRAKSVKKVRKPQKTKK